MRRVSPLGLLAATLFVLAAPLTAQTTFQRTYGGRYTDHGYSVALTTDGGYVIAGVTWSFGTGGGDVYLIRTDTSGNTVWTKTFGGSREDMGHSVQQTTDGGYVIAGHTDSYGAGYWDVYLVKTDASGNEVWSKTFGGSRFDDGYSVQQTTDGGYIITGSYGASYSDVYLIKTDASGNEVWSKTFGGSGNDWGNSVRQTSDGGYIIAGTTVPHNGSDADVYLIKTDATGNSVWTRTFGSSGDDYCGSVRQTSDGGYVIAGTYSYGGGEGDVYLIKTGASGNTIWTRIFDGSSYDAGGSVQQTSDGGYIIVGTTNSHGAGSFDVYLIKADASGDTVWTRTFGGNGEDQGSSVELSSDGGYVIAGTTNSYGAGGDDVYLIKTNAHGNIAIAEPEPPVARKPATATIVRGVLFLPEVSGVKRGASCVMLDISGRKVLNLHPGPNCTAGLPPGVYFLHTGTLAEVRRVVIVP